MKMLNGRSVDIKSNGKHHGSRTVPSPLGNSPIVRVQETVVWGQLSRGVIIQKESFCSQASQCKLFWI